MLVKYIDRNNIKYANYNRILMYDEVQVINPREADFIVAGYKELEIEIEPNFNPDSEYLDYYFVEEGDKVLQKWEVKPSEMIPDFM